MSFQDAVDPRHALDENLLNAALQKAGCAGLSVQVIPVTESTNRDCVLALSSGSKPPFAVVTDLQVAGRGRLDRIWQAPRASSVLMSVAIEPTVPLSRWGWLPLLAGVAACRAVSEFGIQLALKWPNDLMSVGDDANEISSGKVGGILVERDASGAAIIGVGINVDQNRAELPGPQAQSLRTLGAGSIQRELLVVAVLSHLMSQFDEWNATAEDSTKGLAAEYKLLCTTLNQKVQVVLPSAAPLVGVAEEIAESGALRVRTLDGIVEISAGDILHLRPGDVAG